MSTTPAGRWDHAIGRAPDAPSPADPTMCPFCGSPEVSTTSAHVDASTYWRCAACDEVWNVARTTETRPRRRQW